MYNRTVIISCVTHVAFNHLHMDRGRRRFLRRAGTLTLAAALPQTGWPAQRPLHFVALGQAAIQYDLRDFPYAEYGQVASLMRDADICFTDLETSIAEPDSLTPTNHTQFAKAAPPAVLDCLRDWSVNALALSNNHSWDLGAGGILSTIEEVRKRGYAHAGTGTSLAQATAPAYQNTAAGYTAFVAMASGAIREGAAANHARPGVNEVKVIGGVIDAVDASRNLAAIREAAEHAPHIFVYQHNHYWEKDFRQTPQWQRGWARQCIDAGATAFISHGAPLLQGIEIYSGRPIFYDLGSIVFHSKTKVGYYPAEVWESAVAKCTFEDGKLHSMKLVPIVLNERGVTPELFHETRGRPAVAKGADAERILGRLKALSFAANTNIRIVGEVGHLVL